MFWHRRSVTNNADRLRDVFSRPVGSLRTRYSLATAFNRMLETISARAVSVANLEQSHRALINGLPDAIVVFDARKRESLTSLAAGIAHDMNNVLSVVLNAAEAEGAAPSGDSVKTLGTIREAVRRGTSMMRELLAFAGESRMEFMRASPKLLVGDVLQLVSRVVGPNIVLTCDVAPGVPDVDVNQFWKILFNIVKNASEAIGSRLGKIEIAVRPYVMTDLTVGEFYSEHSLASGPGVLFRVTDDGDGIPPEMLERLFDPYVSSKALGRGLGLATVPVLVVSGSAEDEIRQLFAPHPYDAFLAKPYTISELRQALGAARREISGNSQDIKL